MGQIVKRASYIVYIYTTVISTILTLLTANKILSSSEKNIIISDLILSTLLFIFCSYIYIFKDVIIKRLNIHKLLVIFIISGLTSVIVHTPNIRELLNGLYSILFIPLALSIGRYYGVKLYSSKNPHYFLLILLIPLFVGAFIIFMQMGNVFLTVSRDFIFPIIIFFPLIIFYKNNYIKFLLFILIGYLSFYSTKRSAILAFCLMLILLFFASFKDLKHYFQKKIFKLLILSLGLSFIIFRIYISNKEIFDMGIKRFYLMNEDQGSGRSDIYQIVQHEIINGDITSLLFGNGYNAVSKNLFGHPAHNDIMEIAYNYGIITLSAYIIILIIISYKVFQLIFLQRRFVGIYKYIAICIINIMTLGLLNCIITNVLYLFINFFILGIAIEYTNLIIARNNEYRQ